MPPEVIEAWARVLITVGASAGVIGGAYRWTIGRRLGRIEEHISAVRKQVEPNGTDSFLPEAERGETTRTLVVRSRVELSDARERLERLEREAVRDEHERRTG